MRGDERHLETADEKARGQQQVAAAKASRRASATLCSSSREAIFDVAALPRSGIASSGMISMIAAISDQAVRPAQPVDQSLRNRREHEHAGRTGGGAEPERKRSLFRADHTRDRGQYHAEGAGRDAETDQECRRRYAATAASAPAPSSPSGAYTTAPSASVRQVPYLSAITPNIGWPIPQNRFCSAIARPKVVRSQPWVLEDRQLEKSHRRARSETEQRDQAGAGDRQHRQLEPDSGYRST